ncbi:trichohyalin isoform X1 [Astyanax mexicanus]|uniref:C2HC/C3H-type domain-containing protein n=2 Tax=Astyanax mexicanus TaxID=7994 RepID=A0A8B9JXU1_ASTMX|nr:trichohyalin isoform X1 [Astyanax mexicanus]
MPHLHISHSHPAHLHFLGKDVILEKLPPLQSDDKTAQDLFSTSDSQSRDRKKRMTAALKDWDQDYSHYKHWQNIDSVQRTYSSAPTRRRMDSDGDDDFLLEKSEKDIVFPMKPVCHKRAFCLNNCQAGDYYFKQKETSYQNRPDYLEVDRRRVKQVSNRRQVNMNPSKPEPFDTESHHQPSRKRGEAKSNSAREYQALRADQYMLPESQNSLAKEIQRKEVILQEKLMKTGEKLKKIQLRTRSGDKDKTEQRNENMEKPEKQLHLTEKGNWDWESGRERAIAGRRRDEGQREKPRDWGREDRDDRERREKHEIKTDEDYRERRREGIEREYRMRNTQRTSDYKIMSKEWDNHEVRTTQWKTVRVEKDNIIKRERAVEWGRNELREWDSRDRQGRVDDDRQRRGERVKSKRDLENEYQKKQWNVLDAFMSNSHDKVKASSRHDQTNRFTADQHPAQVRLQQQQHSQRAVEKAINSFRKGPPKAPSTEEAVAQSPRLNQTGTRLQQVELSPEMSLDATGQLVPCEICNRCFAEERLEKHIRICEKLQQSKRKTFDSAQFRAKGTELEKFMKTNIQRKAPEPKKNNWRQKHEALIHNLRQARAPAPGGFSPKPSLDVNPDYVSCPHCSRRFAPGPAERHIPKCQNIKSKPPPPRHR